MKMSSIATQIGRYFSLAIIAATISIALASCSSGSGETEQEPLDCGPHGRAVDGNCVCDDGYFSSGGKCVELPSGDGDTDGDTPDRDTDGDLPDGDTDGDIPDGDPDTDGDTPDSDPDPDGDTPDGDPEEDKPCTCPVVSGEFCFDPDGGNPYGAVKVVLAPGAPAACTLSVRVIGQAQSEIFSGELPCDDEGGVRIEEMGCNLSMGFENRFLTLLCGGAELRFAMENCNPVDGDTDPDTDPDPIDTDPDPIDTDPDPTDTDPEVVDTDPDPIDTDPDVVDTDPDIENIYCSSDDQCEEHFYCNPLTLLCKEGCTSDAQCPENYFCTFHGYCQQVIPDGDLPETDAQVCERDDECPEGWWCDLGPAICKPPCTAGSCAPGYECNLETGRCQLAPELEVDEPRVCENDDACDLYWYCDPATSLCTEGCHSNSECPAGNECTGHGRCVPLPDGDLDDDPDLFEEDEAEEEYDCTSDDQCPAGEFCNVVGHECTPGCTSNADCTEFERCNDHGRCVNLESCTPETEETDCQSGYYCSSERGNICWQDCTSDEGCAEVETCDTERGRCYEGCSVDTDCSNGCDICNAAGKCETGQCCGPTGCSESESCIHGRCTPVVDGDTGIPCTQNTDCTAGWYCGPDNICDQDCTTVDECIAAHAVFYYCNEFGQCERMPCDTDEDCGSGLFCNDDKLCDQQCTSNDDCALDHQCNDHGFCEPIPVDGDVDEGSATWCDADGWCEIGYYCDLENNVCTYDCLMDEDCIEGSEGTCNDRGKCLYFVEPDYYDGEIADTNISCGTGWSCPDGMVCIIQENICVNFIPPDDWDMVEAEQDTESVVPGCQDQRDCPYHTSCPGTGESCTAVCLNDSHCSEGQECTFRGYCSDNPPACTTSDQFATCDTDEDCGDYGYCFDSGPTCAGKVCRVDCIEHPDIFAPCPSGFSCNGGRCVSNR